MRNLFIQNKKTALIWLWLSMLVFVLDQISKYAISHYFELYEIKPILPFFNLTLAYNTGAAFSFLSDAGGWQRWVFVSISFVISVVLVIWLARTPRTDRAAGLCFSLILGGALGNLYDRLVFGYVIDFVDLYVNHWHWPAFNIADAAITLGAVMLVIQTVFVRK